jgi:hypothetical protein
MAAIGNSPTQQAFTPAIDYFSGNGSTTAFTLSRPVASVAQVQVTIDNVAQNPSSAYTVSANTITFTSAPLSGTNNIYVYYTSPITQVIAPGQGTVTSDSFGTITNFTTTGNTVLGDATTDTLTVGVTGIVKDSSGNVGIGTASPTQKLHVNSSGAAIGIFQSTLAAGNTNCETRYISTNRTWGVGQNIIQTSSIFEVADITANATRLAINSSGYVGIGTTSPASGLDIRPGITGNFNAITMGYGRSANPTDAVHKISWSSDSLNIEADTANTIASNIIFTNDNTERMRIVSSGELVVGGTTAGGVGTSIAAPDSGGIYCNTATTGLRNQIRFVNPNGTVGSIQTNGSATAYNTSSDYRLKENIVPMTGALDTVSQLKPVTYKWKIDGVDGQGFIAHELQAVIPDCVSGEKDAVDENGDIKPQGVDTSFLVATLTAAIQELKAINDTQAETINALTARIEALENR